MVIDFLILSIFIEAITNLIRKESIFEKFRTFISKTNFFNKMLECGLCTSLHITYLSFIFYLVVPYFKYFVLLIGIWRISNLFHNVIDLIYNKKFTFFNKE